MYNLIDGLEEVESVKINEYGVVYIFYTVTEEYMHQKQLVHKHRVYEIDYTASLTYNSFGIEVEPEED